MQAILASQYYARQKSSFQESKNLVGPEKRGSREDHILKYSEIQRHIFYI
jgi:hypothetical protein